MHQHIFPTSDRATTLLIEVFISDLSSGGDIVFSHETQIDTKRL